MSNAAALDRAREHARHQGVEDRVVFLTGDGYDLPVPDGYFTAALAFESTPQLDLDRFFIELTRVLASGGRLVIETPCLNSPDNGQPDPAIEAFVQMLGGGSLHTVETYRGHARKHGLTPMTIEDITTGVSPSFHRLADVLSSDRAEIARHYGVDKADVLIANFKVLGKCTRNRRFHHDLRQRRPFIPRSASRQ
ncbi:class I SAM-dependent methyltransferase [Actinomadura sp. 3N508]|uniref:class I SAM-dependent methyltransferase n=1 Tax=Actinomadura sp. 3N508 TaxID=3375153 RepID=UPI0037AA1752